MQEFEICYGLSELPSNAVVTYRKAAKAVIEKDGKLLLIYTNQGDYKFPGGGYKNSENAAECIVREMLEETGYQVEKVGKLFGIVLEQKVDDFEPGTYFSMKSEYYSVTIDENNKQKQNLDDYEKEQEFRPVFVEIQEAIENIERILNDLNRKQNPWIKRENDVLKWLSEKGGLRNE